MLLEFILTERNISPEFSVLTDSIWPFSNEVYWKQRVSINPLASSCLYTYKNIYSASQLSLEMIPFLMNTNTKNSEGHLNQNLKLNLPDF